MDMDNIIWILYALFSDNMLYQSRMKRIIYQHKYDHFDLYDGTTFSGTINHP